MERFSGMDAFCFFNQTAASGLTNGKKTLQKTTFPKY